ncbi:MAG TPA: DedA family protein [Myxococcota bacterium]|jgi:membrane protein YqaA with SNARE-associated domain|nr:DedA family protein [Myxococcota bacterium]
MMSDEMVRVPWYKKPMLWLRWLYDWVLSWADSPYAAFALFVLAFTESSFFPIPPDVLLIALVLGRRNKAFFYAGITAVASVLGGLFGWFLGHEFFGPVNSIIAWIVGPDTWYGIPGEGAELITLSGFDFYQYIQGHASYENGSVFLKVKALYDDNAFLAIFTAAFTPIPYKVFTIAAGYFDVSMGILALASGIGRSARFFLVAGLLWAFGPPMKRLIDKYFDILALAFMVLLIGGFLLLKKVF